MEKKGSKSEHGSSDLSTDNSGKNSLSFRTFIQDAFAEYESIGANSFNNNPIDEDGFELINMDVDMIPEISRIKQGSRKNS